MNNSNSGHGGDIRRARSQYGILDFLDFSSNINPLGLPIGFNRAVRSALSEIIHYPEISHLPIRDTLSRHLGMPENTILIGNGSTELLYLIPLALKPKRCLVLSPSYADYERSLKRTETSIDFIRAEEKNDFQWDFNMLEASRYDMVVMGNPNNPTSVYTPKEKIMALVAAHPKTNFLVDEAFIDFLPGPVSLIGTKMPPNLLVLKSLTKFYAIAGLRLGCLVASSEMIGRISKIKEPWTVNCLAAAAGEYLLRQGEHAKKTRDFILKEKKYLFGELAAIPGLKPYHPAANFILVKIRQKNLTSTSLKDKLARKGILIRDCANFRGLSNRYFRVSVNRRNENKMLLTTLKEAIGV